MIEKILERLEEESQYSCSHCIARAIDIVQEVAKEYGKDTNVRSNGWIPVETELPKKSGYYTVTEEMLSLNDRTKVVGTRVAYEVQYDAEKKKWYRANTLRIIAWKPLDAPYQKGE